MADFGFKGATGATGAVGALTKFTTLSGIVVDIWKTLQLIGNASKGIFNAFTKHWRDIQQSAFEASRAIGLMVLHIRKLQNGKKNTFREQVRPS